MLEYSHIDHFILLKNLSMFIYFKEIDTSKYVLLDDTDVVPSNQDIIPIKVLKTGKTYEVFNVRTDELIPNVYVTTKLIDNDVFSTGIYLRRVFTEDNQSLYASNRCDFNSQIPNISNVGKLVMRKWTAEDIFDKNKVDISFPTSVINTSEVGIIRYYDNKPELVDKSENSEYLNDIFLHTRTKFSRILNLSNSNYGHDRNSRNYLGYAKGEYLRELSDSEVGRAGGSVLKNKNDDKNKQVVLYVCSPLDNYLAMTGKETAEVITYGFIPKIEDIEPMAIDFWVITSFGLVYSINGKVKIYNRLFDEISEVSKYIIGFNNYPCNNFYIQNVLYKHDYNSPLQVVYMKNEDEDVNAYFTDEMNSTRAKEFYNTYGDIYINMTPNYTTGKLLPLVETEMECMKQLALDEKLIESDDTDMEFKDIVNVYAEHKAMIVVHGDRPVLLSDNIFVKDKCSTVPVTDMIDDLSNSVVGFNFLKTRQGAPELIYQEKVSSHSSNDDVTLMCDSFNRNQKLLCERLLEKHSMKLLSMKQITIPMNCKYVVELYENIVNENKHANSTELLYSFCIKSDISESSVIQKHILLININLNTYMVIFDVDGNPTKYIEVPSNYWDLKSDSEQDFLNSIYKLKTKNVTNKHTGRSNRSLTETV